MAVELLKEVIKNKIPAKSCIFCISKKTNPTDFSQIMLFFFFIVTNLPKIPTLLKFFHYIWGHSDKSILIKTTKWVQLKKIRI